MIRDTESHPIYGSLECRDRKCGCHAYFKKRMLMKLLPVDLLIGALVALPMTIWLGQYAIPIIVGSAYLWSLGGQRGHSYRSVWITLLLNLPIIWITPYPHLWPLLSAVPMGVIMSLGYGLPSTQPPDSGSPLGRYWSKRFTRVTGSGDFVPDEMKATIAARGTIILGVWTCMVPWLFIK